jgi:hypothetical protein
MRLHAFYSALLYMEDIRTSAATVMTTTRGNFPDAFHVLASLDL